MEPQVPPSGWAEDSLTEFLQHAYKNRWATFANKKPQVQRLVQIDQNFMAVAKDWTNPTDLLAPQFFIRTLSAFRAACEHALAGQASDAYPSLRVCLEFSAYGLYINGNTQLGELWLRRHDDEAALKAVRNEFKIQKLKSLLASKDRKLAKIFDELYQRCIDYGAHPNERAISVSGGIEDKEGKKYISQQLLHGDGPVLDFLLKTTAQVGVCALQIFQHAFPERFELLGVKHALPKLREGL